VEENSTEALREVVSSLVAGNWVRTVGWSARAVLAGVMVAAA
jgi:ATP/ADP translocase